MNETELESMVVRLTGDGSEYKKMLLDAQAQTQEAAAGIESASSRIEQLSQNIGSWASAAVSGLASLGAGKWLHSALDSFVKQEQGMLGLNAAITSGGHAVDDVMPRYQELASRLEETTLQTRGQTLAMARQAEMMGFSGEAAERMIQNSIGLAAATGRDAESLMMVTSAMERGNVQMLRRLPGLRGITDESELLARAQQMITAGMAQAEAMSNSFGGQLQHLEHEWGKLTKQFGSTVAEIFRPMVAIQREIIAHFLGMSKEMKTTIVVVIALVAAFAAIPPLLLLAGTIFNTMFGGVGLLLGVVVVAGVAIAAWANSLGGITQAWEVVKAAAIDTWTWIKDHWEILVAFLGGPVGIAILLIVKNWETLKAAAVATWDFIYVNVKATIDNLTPIVMDVIETIKTGWAYIKWAAVSAWTGIKGVISSWIEWARPTVEGWIDWFLDLWTRAEAWVGDAWDYMKEKALSFWAWLRPIVAASIGYMTAAWNVAARAAEVAWNLIVKGATWLWETVKSVFGFVWDLVKSTFSAISAQASVDWDSVKDFIVDALIGAEFALDNLGSLAALVWTGIQLAAVRGFGVVSHFFGVTLPVYLRWLPQAWSAAWMTSASYSGAVVMNLGRNIVAMFQNLPGLIARTTTWNEIWTPLTQGAINTIQSLPQVPERVMGQLEQRLAAEFRQQGDALSSSFQEFRERRLREIGGWGLGLPPDEVSAATEELRNNAAHAGNEVGNAFAAGAKKGMEKWEASLRFSAEAMFRISEYADMLRGEGHHGRGHHGGGAAGTAGGGEAASLGVPSASSFGGGSPSTAPSRVPDDPQRARIVELLMGSNDLLRAIRDKPPIVFESADL